MAVIQPRPTHILYQCAKCGDPLKQCRSGYRCIVSSNRCSAAVTALWTAATLVLSRSRRSGPIQEKWPDPGEAARSRRSGLLHKKRLTAGGEVV